MLAIFVAPLIDTYVSDTGHKPNILLLLLLLVINRTLKRKYFPHSETIYVMILIMVALLQLNCDRAPFTMAYTFYKRCS